MEPTFQERSTEARRKRELPIQTSLKEERNITMTIYYRYNDYKIQRCDDGNTVFICDKYCDSYFQIPINTAISLLLGDSDVVYVNARINSSGELEVKEVITDQKW